MAHESIIHHVRNDKGIITLINFPESMRRYKHAYFDKKEVIAENLKRGLIIFDDLGAEFITDETLELLIGILEDRIKHNRWTSFTSNKPLSELPYDRRVKSRIAAIIGDNFGELKGKDRRISRPKTERESYGQ